MTDAKPEPRAIDGASCTVFLDAPNWGGLKTAAIGTFACDSNEAGAGLLNQEAERLAAEGFDAVIGPMDGDTWHSYRVVSQSDQSRPFFLEPVSGPHDFDAFKTANFAPISTYVSARAKLSDTISTPGAPVAGVHITSWDGHNAGALIGALFDLSREAFTKNAFYKPISKDAFLKLYEPILPVVDPRLVFFAHSDGQLVGYLFALPDHLDGKEPNTVILKTYASRLRGVGRMLAEHAHRTFHDLGFTHVIHALMHVDNMSRDRSQRHRGTVFRHYDLMGRKLAPNP